MRTALPGEVNYASVDRFTLPHVAIGALYGVLGSPFWAAAALGIGWEVVEREARVRGLLQTIRPDVYRYQDTAENAIVDALAVMVGWWLGRKLLPRPS